MPPNIVWQTGTPTVYGKYLVWGGGGIDDIAFDTWWRTSAQDDSRWYLPSQLGQPGADKFMKHENVVAWCLIEPFERETA